MQLYFATMLPASRYQSKGFTLIEIMVVIAILGILSAIALPSYTEYVKRTRRTAVQEQMLQIQQLMERYRSPRDTYVGADTNALPQSGLSRYPTDTSQAELYRLVVSPPALTQTTYTITATRAGAMVDDECGNFTLNSIGQRAVVDNSGGRTLATCWPQ